MLMLIAVAMLTAANFALTKYYQKDGNDSNRELMMFNSVVGLFTGIIFLAVNDFKVHITPFSVLMGFSFMFFLVAYRMIGFKIMEGETIALYTVFLMSGGMLLPYIWGVLFLKEEPSVLKMIGLLLIIISLVISNICGKKIKLKTTLMCIAVFILNGCTSIVSKMHSINKEFAVPEIDFIIIMNLIMAIACFIVALFYKNNNENKIKKDFSWQSIVILLLVAIVNGVGFFMQLKCAKVLPATVVFPVTTGGAVIFTAIAGWVFFKEKITKRLAFGLILCLAGTCMFL